MLISIDLKWYQDYQENTGLKRDGFSKRILWVGFNGIVDILMEEEFLRQTKSKLKDGKTLEDTFWQQKKIVKKVTQDVERDKDKQYYSGLTIHTDKNFNHLKNGIKFFLFEDLIYVQKDIIPAMFQV